MIFYFSGTGNSYHAAKFIAENTKERLISIAEARDNKNFEYEVENNESIGFVFPVYAWAPPQIVLDFISRLSFMGEIDYVFSIATCGSEEGNATSVIGKELQKKGLLLNSAFTLVMPSNYIIGADVDSKEEKERKLKKADQKLGEINEIVKVQEKGVFHTVNGGMAGIKSKLVNPLFNRFARDTGRFYATDDCNRCGLCEKICPIHTITLEEKPVWGKDCLQCLACINRCPQKAIQYGKGTKRKGRYFHPDLGQK